MAEYLLPSHPDSLVEDRFSVCEEYADCLEIPRWALIRTLLQQPVQDVAALVDIISTLQYDQEFNTLISVLQLSAFQDFFSKTFPAMIQVALRMPELFPSGSLSLLQQGTECSVSLTREQVACLLVHMFLCTLQRPVWNKHWVDFKIWYNSTSSPTLAYLHCLLTYFSQLDATGRPPNPDQVVEFKRCVLTTPPDWSKSKATFEKDCVTPSYSLQPVSGCNVEVSFANKDVGFGVSGTQEEVKMAMSPEACVVVLLAPTLLDNETLLIQGARQVGVCEGIGRNVKFTGPFTEHKDWSMRCIVAMDAMELDNCDGESVCDLNEDVLVRELNKVYCGFRSIPTILGEQDRVTIATGHWGCGAFGGNKCVKSLVQIMAASEAKRRLIFHDITPISCDDDSQGHFVDKLCDFVGFLSWERVTVSQLFSAILKTKSVYCESSTITSLFDKIRTFL